MTSENFKPAGKTNVFAQPVVLCLLLVGGDLGGLLAGHALRLRQLR